MLATDRYLNHLLEMLDQGKNPAGPSARSENDLQAFFDMIAGDRIRIEPTDWQGYPVSGLLWNLPDLKIAGENGAGRTHPPSLAGVLRVRSATRPCTTNSREKSPRIPANRKSGS